MSGFHSMTDITSAVTELTITVHPADDTLRQLHTYSSTHTPTNEPSGMNTRFTLSNRLSCTLLITVTLTGNSDLLITAVIDSNP